MNEATAAGVTRTIGPSHGRTKRPRCPDPHASAAPISPRHPCAPRRLKTEALAGLVVALAPIPEAIAFSVIVVGLPRITTAVPPPLVAIVVLTVAVVSATHNLAIGVGAGVLAAMALFVRRVAHFVTVERTVVELNCDNVYTVDGELFFASSNDLYTRFEYALDAEPGISRVIVDLHASHLWDASTIAVLDAVTEKYRRHGREIELIGLNAASVLMRERLAGKSNPDSYSVFP